MLKLYSNLSDQKILSFQEEGRIAKLEDLVVQAESIKVLGLFVRQEQLFKAKRKFVVLIDVLEFSNAIYVQSSEVLLGVGAIVRLPNLEDDYFPLIGLKVETIKGEKLGKISDYVFDTLSGEISKIHIEPKTLSLEKEGRIIPRSQIHKLTPKKLILKDNQLAKPAVEKEAALSQASFSV